MNFHYHRTAMICVLFLFSLAIFAQAPAPAENVSAPTPGMASADKPSIALSPAVIMARGGFGQSLTQTLTFTNNTGMDLAFDLEAQDVVVKDGKRVFVAAGELPGSIAATAVFAPKSLMVKAHTSAPVEVRLTLPEKTDIRAVSAIFMGTDKLQTSSSAVAMTASLASLVTFNLSDAVNLTQEPAHVMPASNTENMKVSQFLVNAGSEPVVPEGTAAVLNAKGVLAGKATFAPQRLLPGERLEFVAEFPDQLSAGDYRALCTFQFEGKTLTSVTEFKVP
jgi:hypothetical protein